MGDYNLNGLDSRNFEHIVQAISFNEIATGITPFGDGPDGGREATFKGVMDYPSKSDSWDGYLVIQCKFKKKTSDVTKDGQWAINELEKDLKKFLDLDRGLPKPEYYLFVTNVVLTPIQDTGSQDKIDNILGKYASKLGLKDYAIWGYDKLCRYIVSVR